MKKQLLTITAIIAASTLSAQIVGDASLGTYDFNNNQLFFTGSGSQYAPKLVITDGKASAIWAHGTSPNTGIFHTTLDPVTYQSTSPMDTVVSFVGVLNTDGDAITHQVNYEASTENYLSIYRFADNIDVVNKDFSLRGKLFQNDDFTGTDIVIEGPMSFANDLPFWWKVVPGPTGEFGIIYHSDGGSSTDSEIKFKSVNANTGAVTPASVADAQTGLSLTFQGATFADIAWNEAEQLYGVVFITGTGNNTKVKFVSCDADGTVVTSEKDVIADNAFLSTMPIIREDGNGFALAWVDYRTFQIPNETLQSGKPMSRFAQLTATGDLVANTGTAPYFDSADNSLIVSNPYQYEVYSLRQDLVVMTPGEKYGVIFTSQNAPYETYISEVQISGGEMKSMVPILLSDPTLTTDQPSIAFDDDKYIGAFQQYTGSSYENRISVGEFNPDGGSTGSLETVNGIQFKIFPNPTQGMLTIQSNDPIEEYTITNQLGQVVLSGNTFFKEVQLDLTELTAGIYIFNAKGVHKNVVVK